MLNLIHLAWLPIVALTISQTIGCAADKKKTKVETDSVAAVTGDLRIISDADAGKEIILTVGQNLIIDLPANPSTGYRWNIVEINEDLLSLVSREFRQDKAPPGKVGVGGTLVLNFMAVDKGDFKLKLEYSRAVSSGSDIAKTFEVDIKIE
jgi:inhibitor of cysteine peptidase